MAAEELAGRIGQTAEACEALGVARSTLYRRRQPVTPKPKRRPRPHRALDETEREEVLGALHCERFVDKAPAQVWATLLDEGTYLLFFTLNREDFSFVIHLDRQPRTSRRREAQTGSRARSERTLDAVKHSRTLMEWWPFLIFHRGGLRIKVINNTKTHGRLFCCGFFAYYNFHHRHSGIGLMTPADVHYGRAEQLTIARRQILLEAQQAHPERFVRGTPQPPVLPPPLCAYDDETPGLVEIRL